MNIKAFRINTTSLCNAWCKHCNAVPWMRANPDYHLSLGDIDNWIKYSKESGYKFGNVTLTGGEPLLWKNLLDCVKKLNNSGLINKLIMYSNAIAVNENNLSMIGQILDNISILRISRYIGNENKIKLIRDNFPNNKKIKVINKTKFIALPTKKIPNSLPANCNCDAYDLTGSNISLCGPAKNIICRLGWNQEDFSYIIEPLKKDYLNRLSKIPKRNKPYCQYCVGNSKVRKNMHKEQNIIFTI